MFWILLGIICVIALILFCNIELLRNWDVNDFVSGTFFFLCIMSISIFLILGINGMIDYPYLLGQHEEIKVYQSRIKDIRNAVYKTTSKATLINGSIENMQQSTNLSKYIVYLAKKEAEYNSYLVKCKFYKDNSLFYWFIDGWAISDDIDKLPILKKTLGWPEELCNAQPVRGKK